MNEHLFTAEQLNKLVLGKMSKEATCDQIFKAEDGKKGLCDCNGKLLVPALFDDIPERYTQLNRGNYIPVVRSGKYYLYDICRHILSSKAYDNIFRYICEDECFVVVNNGKVGLLNRRLEIIVPVEMDEIYEMQDIDSCVVFTKEGKWGAYQFGRYASPIFDDLEVWSEQYVKVWLCGVQGWIDCDGNFTEDESMAYFGSWYDADK